MELSLPTLDGKRLDLSDQRGRPVLLAFWAAWSERSIEMLTRLEDLRGRLGTNAPVIFAGISIDAEIGSAQEVTRSRNIPWPQGHLDGETRATVTAQFESSPWHRTTKVASSPRSIPGPIRSPSLSKRGMRTPFRRNTGSSLFSYALIQKSGGKARLDHRQPAIGDSFGCRQATRETKARGGLPRLIGA
ncbi:MAG: redoxin domain-containing protein [Verrucomicrobiae bacterium]|nr:redoxin domain-containing protein [Verrucomicrobiae bacterium]